MRMDGFDGPPFFTPKQVFWASDDLQVQESSSLSRPLWGFNPIPTLWG